MLSLYQIQSEDTDSSGDPIVSGAAVAFCAADALAMVKADQADAAAHCRTFRAYWIEAPLSPDARPGIVSSTRVA